MEWVLIPAIIGAAAATATLGWRLWDAINARPRVRVCEWWVRCAGWNGRARDTWQAFVRLENESTAVDSVLDVVVKTSRGGPWRLHYAGAPPASAVELRAGFPVRLAGDLRGDGAKEPVDVGTVVSGSLEVTFHRARKFLIPFTYTAEGR